MVYRYVLAVLFLLGCFDHMKSFGQELPFLKEAVISKDGHCCRGKRGPRGHRGKRGKRGHKGKTGPQGPQGPQGPSGGSTPTVAGNLTFTFTTNRNTLVSGNWQFIVIAPDGTQTSQTINIQDPSTTINLVVGPTVQLGIYTIVLYNQSISGLATNVVTGSVLVTNSFNSDTTRYNFFTVLPNPGFNQELPYRPFLSP